VCVEATAEVLKVLLQDGQLDAKTDACVNLKYAGQEVPSTVVNATKNPKWEEGVLC
jgi:hypothetical protein